ncbi:Mitotic spindle checkpoint protein MAD2 [Giardia muris]|uniref:Mitotic spindle checkpoint protein MAD2 n=1 Tax=Giardia muris TaxID=5742 RepID=A0A4Z1SWW0_GIAMU|nr:Mitotic spindle checkpoint protein MAD2 [Giardia muris]|eukprot:TNJ30040.1 Mitotic spindle checkpoint protein MAD2 [Giardia muris]
MATQTKGAITLRGSTALVTEYFAYSINTILYLRGVYGQDSFAAQSKYGISLMVAKDPALNKYLSEVLQRVAEWLMSGKVQKLVVTILPIGSSEAIEKWEFDVQNENVEAQASSNKPEADVQREIQAILRQINASVSFLPILSDPVTFDILIFADGDVPTPAEWEECAGRDHIQDAVEVKFRNFTTKIHKVDTSVTYKGGDTGF